MSACPLHTTATPHFFGATRSAAGLSCCRSPALSAHVCIICATAAVYYHFAHARPFAPIAHNNSNRQKTSLPEPEQPELRSQPASEHLSLRIIYGHILIPNLYARFERRRRRRRGHTHACAFFCVRVALCSGCSVAAAHDARDAARYSN